MIINLILDIFIVIGTAFCVIYEFFKMSEDEKPIRAKLFRYYTTDSNLFSALVSLISIILIICGAQTEEWLMALRLSATASVTVTFLTVLFFLAPTQGFKFMFGGPAFYMHLLGPLAAIFSLYLKSCGSPMPYIFILWGFITVPIYGLIYCIMVVAKGPEKGGWKDFYGFNRGGRWKISIIIMGAAALVISCALMFIYNLVKF